MSENIAAPASSDIRLDEAQLLESDPDLQQEHDTLRIGDTSGEPAHISPSVKTNEPLPYQFVPLKMGGRGGTHRTSEGSKALIEKEVAFEDLKKMTTLFYELAFKDDTLDKFIRSHGDQHADRFAKWVHQKLSGSTMWDQDRQERDLTPVKVAGDRMTIVRDRTSAHSAAWYSPKRPAEDVGRHFKLDECRVWMRLHFYAMRQSGLAEKSPTFADYYVRFIGHFVSVYERRATKFARESFRWSADPSNVDRYIRDGRKMNDVLGVEFQQAKTTLTEEDLDYKWPYYELQ
eukprot:scaffold2322_cov135-Cylindrotheca_fusiformis.AAC.11